MNRDTDVAATRTKVRRAFTALRKTGAIARMNFGCCMGCASSELSEIAEKRGLHRIVYFHQQDNYSFVCGSDLHVRYCLHIYRAGKKPVLPMTAVEADLLKTWGHLICAALQAEGLNVEWNGSTDHTIVVKPIEVASDE